MNGKTKKHGAKKPARPLRRAKRWGSQVPAMAGKLLAVAAASVVTGLVFSALQMIGALWLRALLTLLILAGVLLIHYNEGATKGLADADASRDCERAEKAGRAPSAREDAACYQPLKAACAAALVYGAPLALALLIAAAAREYTYTLQDLPSWLTAGYGARADVMAPLAAYTATVSLTAQDVVRMIVRMMELLYVNLFADPLKLGAVIDRLSPLMLLTYPIAYMIGYLRGPALSAKKSSMNRRAKKAAVRKAGRSHLAEELVGGGGEVHYGHQADEEKKKRRELV